MLPESHCHCYGEFRKSLISFRQRFILNEVNYTGLAAESQKVQLFFRDQVRQLAVEPLTMTDAQRSHAYQVEMDKQLRLLAMDVMFLQAAKQPETIQQRSSAVQDRLQKLIAYCDALLSD
jgi:hypothetical protein